MKLLPISFLLICTLTLKAQLTDNIIFDETYLATKTTTFTLTEKGLNGPGAQLIEQAIRQSQFTILGESHGSAQISNFTKAIVPYLAASDYQHFACEIGPHSARKLTHLSTPPNRTLKQLTAFNQKYAFTEIDDVPLPFFESHEDAAFLSSIKQQQMDIWGLDQEYYSALFFLFDELLNLAVDKPNFAEIETQKETAAKRSKKLLIEEEKSEQGDQVFAKILAEPTVQGFFGVFQEEDSLALQIIKDLKISWDIYNRYLGGVSHQDRLNYIRSNFLREYQQAAKLEAQPKVFVKVGALHAPKNPIGGPDIGSLLQEMAEENGTQSTHLTIMSRYQKEKEQVTDFLETNPQRYGRYALFLAAAKPDHGLVIDLRAIRNDLANGQLKYPKNANLMYLKTIIENFDLQIILPTDYPATPAK